MDNNKLKKLLLHRDKETRKLGQNLYSSYYTLDREDPEGMSEFFAESQQLDILSKGIFEQLKESNIHVYDPSRFSTLILEQWL